MRVHANYLEDKGLPGQITASKVAGGVLDDVGQGGAINFAKKQKNDRSRSLKLSQKIASQYWGIQAFSWRIPAKKVRRQRRRSCSGRRRKRRRNRIEVIGQKHGLEDADLGLSYADVRHFYAPAKCFFGVVETGKGRRKFY